MAADELTVTVKLGATLATGSDAWIKPEIEIRGLRPGTKKQVESQLKRAMEVTDLAFVAIDDKMEQVISDMVSGLEDQPGIRDRLDGLEEWVRDYAKPSISNIAAEVARQKEPRGKGKD